MHPLKAKFLAQLSTLSSRKRTIESSGDASDVKRRRIGELTLELNGHQCRLSELALSFTLNPTSKVCFAS